MKQQEYTVTFFFVGIRAPQIQSHMVSVCTANYVGEKRISGLLRVGFIRRFCLYSDDIIYRKADFMTQFLHGG